MANSLPPESVLFNVSFHTKTSNRINNIESGEGGFEKNTTNFLPIEYLMSELILQHSAVEYLKYPVPHALQHMLSFKDCGLISQLCTNFSPSWNWRSGHFRL